MKEKEGPDKLFGETNPSENQLSINDKKENSNEIQDNDEEIIELTDPDDTTIQESEEEIIEPADFLNDLSEDDTTFFDQADSKEPSLDDNDDIIELTDNIIEPPTGTSNSIKAEKPTSDSPPPSDDKDLFVFTDSEAFIDDKDILSDTVFADEPSKANDQNINEEQGILAREKKEPASEDSRILDDTVFANELSENNDEELAVLAEIDDQSPQIENGMFKDTVFSSKSSEINDEELAVLAEPEDNKNGKGNSTDNAAAFVDEPPADDGSDMILLEDIESETANDENEIFIQTDIDNSTEGKQLEIENARDNDITDSLGIDLESNINLSEEVKAENEITSAIDPELNNLESGLGQFKTEASKGMEYNATQEDQQNQPISIQPDQLEKTVEKVITKMLTKNIDKIIIDVIEKAVKTDIEKIKKELLKGTTDDL
jgi:hypothetical protein